MDGVTLQNVANIVTLVFPGYVAIRLYSLIYAKRERSQSALLIESVVFSLPIVAMADSFWYSVFDVTPSAINLAYVAILAVLAVIVGVTFAFLRRTWPLKQLATSVGLGGPDGDFMRSQFTKLKSNALVTVTLKNGEIFSGTPAEGKVFSKDTPREYRWNNLAWYNKETGEWDFRDSSLVINLDEIHYIEIAS